MENKTHWLQSPNKNYLGHWDLPENGITLTIKSAKWEAVKNPVTSKEDACRVIRFKEDYKPMICNQTNAQSILKSTDVKFMEDSSGCKISLFTGSAKYMGERVPCIRVQTNKEVIKEDSEHDRIIGFINKGIIEKSVPYLVSVEKNLRDNDKAKPEYLDLIAKAKLEIIDNEEI